MQTGCSFMQTGCMYQIAKIRDAICSQPLHAHRLYMYNTNTDEWGDDVHTLPLTLCMGSTTTATALSDSASKLCWVLISTPDSQQPNPGWEWYQPTTISGLEQRVDTCTNTDGKLWQFFFISHSLWMQIGTCKVILNTNWLIDYYFYYFSTIHVYVVFWSSIKTLLQNVGLRLILFSVSITFNEMKSMLFRINC